MVVKRMLVKGDVGVVLIGFFTFPIANSIVSPTLKEEERLSSCTYTIEEPIMLH